MAKDKSKGFFAEFKKFITRGNVLDMSVGVIVGGAFTAIVTALTNNILKPLINWIIAAIVGGNGGIEAYTMLKATVDEAGKVDLASSIYIDWGAFISAIINFLLVAFILFCIVRAFNKAKEAGSSLRSDKAKAVAAYKKQGMTKAEAEAKYEADVKAAEEAAAATKAAEEAAAAEAAAKENKYKEDIAKQTELLEKILASMAK